MTYGSNEAALSIAAVDLEAEAAVMTQQAVPTPIRFPALLIMGMISIFLTISKPIFIELLILARLRCHTSIQQRPISITGELL